MPYPVVFKRVKHTAVKDPAAGRVMNQIMGYRRAAATEHDADTVPVELPDVVNAAVVDDVFAFFAPRQNSVGLLILSISEVA